MTKSNVDESQRKLIDLWEAKLTKLFGNDVPVRAEWTDPDRIGRVLKIMSGEDAYFFQPGDGGLDLIDCRSTSEGYIEWTDENEPLEEYAFILKPTRLVMLNPGTQNHEANFVLEVEGEAAGCPTGEVTNEVGIEQCYELDNGVYAPCDAGYLREYRGKPFPATARVVRRATRSVRFALFSKGSFYYRYDGYKALHNDPVAFEKLVNTCASVEIM